MAQTKFRQNSRMPGVAIAATLAMDALGANDSLRSSDDFPKPNVFMIGQLLKLLKVVGFLAKTYPTFLENSSRQRDLVDLVAGRCVSKFRCLCKSSFVARKLNLLDIQAICRCGSANTATLT